MANEASNFLHVLLTLIFFLNAWCVSIQSGWMVRPYDCCCRLCDQSAVFVRATCKVDLRAVRNSRLTENACLEPIRLSQSLRQSVHPSINAPQWFVLVLRSEVEQTRESLGTVIARKNEFTALQKKTEVNVQVSTQEKDFSGTDTRLCRSNNRLHRSNRPGGENSGWTPRVERGGALAQRDSRGARGTRSMSFYSTVGHIEYCMTRRPWSHVPVRLTGVVARI